MSPAGPRPKVLCVEPLRYDADLRAFLAGALEVDYLEIDGKDALARTLASAPYVALLTRLGVRVDADVLMGAPSLRFVVTPTTGLDHIDVEACTGRDVRVFSLRGETEFLGRIRSTAEHTFALLMSLVRRIPAAHADVLAGRWRREPFLANELDGASLGIVGYGRLGRMVAQYGVTFGMHVRACDVVPKTAEPGVELIDERTVLATSDVLSLHLPLDASTAGWLDRSRLASMKRGAVLVNTARGELVDEAALVEALSAGHVAGAALDVLAGDGSWEGVRPRPHALVDFARGRDDVILTPHVGGYGRASIARTRHFVCEKLIGALA